MIVKGLSKLNLVVPKTSIKVNNSAALTEIDNLLIYLTALLFIRRSSIE